MQPYPPGVPFEPHPESVARKRSAVALIKYLLAENAPEALPAHRRELLSALLWKMTESECRNKHATRFQSDGALSCCEKANLRHDHVLQRKKMIAALERAAPNEVEIENILAQAVGCTVTVEEHARLSKLGHEYDGWERYRKAEITVIDTATGTRLI